MCIGTIISPFKEFSFRPYVDNTPFKPTPYIGSPDNNLRFNSPVNSKYLILLTNYIFRDYII